MKVTAQATDYENQSCLRLLRKGYRPKRPETGAAHAGEAQQSAKTTKEKPLRKAKRWNKCGPA